MPHCYDLPGPPRTATAPSSWRSGVRPSKITAQGRCASHVMTSQSPLRVILPGSGGAYRKDDYGMSMGAEQVRPSRMLGMVASRLLRLNPAKGNKVSSEVWPYRRLIVVLGRSLPLCLQEVRIWVRQPCRPNPFYFGRAMCSWSVLGSSHLHC